MMFRGAKMITYTYYYKVCSRVGRVGHNTLGPAVSYMALGGSGVPTAESGFPPIPGKRWPTRPWGSYRWDRAHGTPHATGVSPPLAWSPSHPAQR